MPEWYVYLIGTPFSNRLADIIQTHKKRFVKYMRELEEKEHDM